MDEYPAGKFWCPKCVMKTDFIIAEGHNPHESEPPLECWECGYIHDKIVQELNPDGTPRKTPRVVSAIPRWMRHDARVQLRREFRMSVERCGFAVENFTVHGRRKKDEE